MDCRVLCVFVLLPVLLSPLGAHADIYRWDTGQALPGTAGIEPGPEVQLSNRDLQFARLSEQDLRNSSFEFSNLTHAWLQLSTLTDASLANANLTNSVLWYSNLTNANLADAIVNGAVLESVIGFTQELLYSTASYQMKDLSGIVLNDNDLAGWDFSGQNLTGAGLSSSDLTNTDLTGAVVNGAYFGTATSHGFTREQLYSTASYRLQNLRGIQLIGNDLSDWDFTGQDLTFASFQNSILTNTNLTGADLRDAAGGDGFSEALLTNTILPDGSLPLLAVTDGQPFLVRDHDGWWFDPVPVPIRVQEGMFVGATGKLQLVIDDDSWGSTISFQPGIPVQLGGTLELSLADDVDVLAQLGRTLQLFDWTGVHPTGQFELASLYGWDLANLYTTGEVTLLGPPLAGDVNFDGELTVWDVDAIAAAIRRGDLSILFDVNRDSLVSQDDHHYWISELKQTWLGDADLDGEFNSSDLTNVLAAGEYEDTIVGNSTWSTGDWNADGEFDSSDMIEAFADGGYEVGPRTRAAAVPEPSSITPLIISCLGLLIRRQVQRGGIVTGHSRDAATAGRRNDQR